MILPTDISCTHPLPASKTNVTKETASHPKYKKELTPGTGVLRQHVVEIL